MKKNGFLINSRFVSFFLLVVMFMLFSCRKTSTEIQEPAQKASVCLTANEYLSYTINGTAYNYTLPSDNFQFIMSTFSTYITNTTYKLKGFNSLTTNNPTILAFDGENITSGITKPLGQFLCPQFIYGSNTNTSYNVNITEYGNIGEYMSGNFTAVLPGMNNNGTLTGVSYNVECCFRIRRVF
jgi:hypothetical protein